MSGSRPAEVRRFANGIGTHIGIGNYAQPRRGTGLNVNITLSVGEARTMANTTVDVVPDPTLAEWPTRTANDWQEFVGIVQNYVVRPRPHFLYCAFRGQADASQPLRPKLIRWPDQIPYELLDVEKALRDEIQAVAHLHQDASHLPDDGETLEWWALMQHFGAPTRLLDWTASAYVAAYFAVAEPWRTDGAVWLFDTHALKRRLTERGAPDIAAGAGREFFAKDDRKPFLYVYPPQKLSDRSWAQQGLFTVCTDVIADHGDILRDVFRDAGGAWLKIIIPSHAKGEILMHLRAVNVTAAALFPGLDGAGRAGCELWQLALARVGD